MSTGGKAGLAALTESAQKNKPVLKKKPTPVRRPAPRRRPEKRQTVEFDEGARHEFLTGFSKRKQQRKQAAHENRQARIREELKDSRRAATEARREQAAENVRAERRAYGLLSDDEEEAEPMHAEHDFENEERRAHVTVQEFDVDADWHAPPPPKVTEQLPPSSRRAARKEAAVAPKKPKAAPNPKRPSGSLTAILEPDVVNAAHYLPIEEAPKPAPAKREHTYLSAAERMQERKVQRERNHKQAELRRESNRARAKSGPKKKISTTGQRRK